MRCPCVYKSLFCKIVDWVVVVFWWGFFQGEMMKVGAHDTSVHPGFRTALMSLSATIGWDTSTLDYSGLPERGAVVGEQLSTFGDGQYPNEAGKDVVHWQQEFWGSNYKRLLAIKHQWDPDNFFTCRECVGSESHHTHASGHLNTHPFVPAVGWSFGSNMILDSVQEVLTLVTDGLINKII